MDQTQVTLAISAAKVEIATAGDELGTAVAATSD
jgi:hypothetical protein